jgi:hypothetical protein
MAPPYSTQKAEGSRQQISPAPPEEVEGVEDVVHEYVEFFDPFGFVSVVCTS